MEAYNHANRMRAAAADLPSRESPLPVAGELHIA
jgi:hypothetical protein